MSFEPLPETFAPVAWPRRRISFTFTDDTIGDEWLSVKIAAAAAELFRRDPGGEVDEFTASNGIHIKVSAHELALSIDNVFRQPTKELLMSRDDDAIEAQIQSKGLTAPRVTQQRINDVIASEYFFTAEEGAVAHHFLSGDKEGFAKLEPDKVKLGLLTICVLVLKNGFTVTGESACASPENFDAQIGRDLARQNARQKIWALEGYLLKEQLAAK